MESNGIQKCPCPDLSLAFPGHGLNTFSNSGGHGGSGHNNRNAAELAVHMGIRGPASGGENGGVTGVRSQPCKTRLSGEQYEQLDEYYRLNNNHRINFKEKQELADQLKLQPKQVDNWFHNRRTRSKLKDANMEIEYLNYLVDMLKNVKHHLLLEVQELRVRREEERHRRHLEVEELSAARMEQTATLAVLRALKEENCRLQLEVEELRAVRVLPILRALHEHNRLIDYEVEVLAATGTEQPATVATLMALKEENCRLQLELEQIGSTRHMQPPVALDVAFPPPAGQQAGTSASAAAAGAVASSSSPGTREPTWLLRFGANPI